MTVSASLEVLEVFSKLQLGKVSAVFSVQASLAFWLSVIFTLSNIPFRRSEQTNNTDKVEGVVSSLLSVLFVCSCFFKSTISSLSLL